MSRLRGSVALAAGILAAGILALVSSAVAGAKLTLHVATGGAADIALSENLTTGYAWRISAGDSRGLGEIVAIDDVGHQPGASMPGAPGTHRWTVRGLKPGTASIAFAYQRPWEKKPGETRQIAIEVTP